MQSLMASGFWPLEVKSQHINVLEMKTVWLALQAFAPHIQRHSVLLVTDSTTVSAYINGRGGGGGGVTLVHNVQSSGIDCIMVCQEQNTHQSETLVRKTQRFGRLCVQERGHCSDRMVTESASDKPDISHLGYSSSGSICYSPEQEITAVRVTCSGPRSICNRRPESELDGHVGVCLSSLSSHSLMSEKDSERGMHCLSDSTTLGGTGVVFSSNVIGHSSSSSTHSKEGSIVSACIQNIASHPQVFRLHAWLLCNNKCKRQASLSQLPDESIQRRDLPPTICMITGGNLGWIGVSAGKWIPSILLWIGFGSS